MASYSFGTAPLMGTSLEGTKSGSGPAYDAMYRRTHASSPNAYHTEPAGEKSLDAHNTALADYFLKQQQITLERSHTAREGADISSMVAAVAAASTGSSMHTYGYAPRACSQSPRAPDAQPALDALPGFLSSLPMAGHMDSKYAGAPNQVRRTTPSGGLLAAAAAAAASVVGDADAGTNAGPQGYGRNAYTQSVTNESAYTVDGLSFATSAAMTAPLGPSLSEQSSGMAVGAELTPYSVSALSRPLAQATVLLGDSGSNYSAGLGQLTSVSQIPTMLSPQSQYYAQRSYSEYSAYYRSPSTMGVTTASAAPAASGASGAPGASPTNATQLAMGPAYYSPAYQYVRSNPYSYYSPSRYLPYGAYPQVRHFVSPARPFKCETCDQSFSRNHDLKRHVKIHSGVKPHKCNKCGKSFGRSDALKRHSMVKRCRSSAGQARPAGRLAPVSALFAQTSAPQVSASNLLAARTNSI
ncbi:hypothetical protein GGH12_000355 [Coemansia sp. RSA 1822]|nr:hypothetical protein IW147_002078 [Coemansia sp. RSA 720]KAJ2567462.1 hypothetical protein GGH12_000355 [Coemansia sp. RSA 1822]